MIIVSIQSKASELTILNLRHELILHFNTGFWIVWIRSRTLCSRSEMESGRFVAYALTWLPTRARLWNLLPPVGGYTATCQEH